MVNVVVFNKNENDISTATQIEYNEKGQLKNWPIGFFDPDGVWKNLVVEISNEVIEYLEKNISQLTCDSPICLNLNIIAYECYNHEHFLYAEYSVLEYLKNYPLLSDVSKQVYTYFFSKCYNLSSYIASTKISICYYMGDNIKHCGDKFFIPITKKTIWNSLY